MATTDSLTSIEAQCERAEAACRAVAPLDLEGAPLYIVPQSQLPDDLGGLKDNPQLSPERLARTRNLMNEAVCDCLVTGYEDLIDSLTLPDPDDRAPQGGQTMIIYVRKYQGDYQFRVNIPGHSADMQYSVSISGDPNPGALYLQATGGSGVEFSRARVPQEAPPIP